MKKKTFEKKLQLKKMTLTNLEMAHVKGGDPETYDKLCAINSEGPACTVLYLPACE